jgi:hypothetical protein
MARSAPAVISAMMAALRLCGFSLRAWLAHRHRFVSSYLAALCLAALACTGLSRPCWLRAPMSWVFSMDWARSHLLVCLICCGCALDLWVISRSWARSSAFGFSRRTRLAPQAWIVSDPLAALTHPGLSPCCWLAHGQWALSAWWLAPTEGSSHVLWLPLIVLGSSPRLTARSLLCGCGSLIYCGFSPPFGCARRMWAFTIGLASLHRPWVFAYCLAPLVPVGSSLALWLARASRVFTRCLAALTRDGLSP